MLTYADVWKAGALSARLCAKSGGQYDVDISAQQIVSCNGKEGCRHSLYLLYSYKSTNT